MKFFAILSSMPFESDNILAGMKNIRAMDIAGKTVYRGKLSGHDIVLTHTGIGKVNAAHSVTCITACFTIKGVINIGVGGAYPSSGLHIGDIAIASKEIYGDDGVMTAKGWEDLRLIGIPLVKTRGKEYFNDYQLDQKLMKIFLKTTSSNSPIMPLNRRYKIRSGNFVTISAVTGNRKRALELERRFDAICENMEGAAVAQVCTIYDIPMLEIRGISNIAGIRDKRKWELKHASENCQKVVLHLMKELKAI